MFGTIMVPLGGLAAHCAPADRRISCEIRAGAPPAAIAAAGLDDGAALVVTGGPSACLTRPLHKTEQRHPQAEGR